MANVKLAKEGATVVEVRASTGAPLGGMRPDIDAAALERTDFIQLQNIRRIGPSIVGRPGQSLFYDLGTCEPTGIGDFPVGAKHRLMCVGDGCPGVSPGAGFSLASWSAEQKPRFQGMVYRPGATSFCAARFERAASETGLLPAVDAIMFAADGILYRLSNVPFSYGIDSLALTNAGQEVPVWTVPSGYASITCMIQHGSELILSVNNGAGSSAVFSWDGLTFRRELSGIDEVTGFGLFRDMLIAGHNGGTNLIRVRTAAGVWSTVAPASGTVKIPGNFRCASYKDNFYIPPGDDRLYVFDGLTSLTEIAAGTNGVTAGAIIHSVESAFGNLYYCWDAAGPTEVKIGAFDGTTWDPAHKDILVDFANMTGARSLRKFQGNLIFGVLSTLPSGFLHLLSSPRSVTNGTWTELQTVASTASQDVRELLVY